MQDSPDVVVEVVVGSVLYLQREKVAQGVGRGAGRLG